MRRALDHSRFNTLTRHLAPARSRRGVLGVVGAVLSGALLPTAPPAAAATCAKLNQLCSATQKGKPVGKHRPKCCAGLSCQCADRFCKQHRCRPPACRHGLSPCGRSCVDLQRDRTHCGGCNVLCAGEPTQCCHGECSDPLTDQLNCGHCDHGCTSHQRCVEGVCVTCSGIGGLCQTGTDCCLGLQCQGSTCQASCQTEGESCGSGNECCGVYSCLDHVCHQTCQDLGQVCDTAGQCCSETAACQGRVCCQNYGTSCEFSDDCCFGVPCTGHRCVYP
jgi:hypothetical protein